MTTAVPSTSPTPQHVRDYAEGAADSIVIDGTRRPASSGATLPVHDPGTGEEIGVIAAGDAADVDEAVRSAGRAFERRWSVLSPAARGRALFALADLIEEHADELATLESVDNGKPFMESRYVDVAVAAEVYRYYGGWTTKLAGQTLPVSPTVGEAMAYTRREPLGVVGAIVPWNFPFMITSWKLGPALAAGNTVVLKPSELTSLSALRLVELMADAGLPPGVVNLVTGLGPEAGQAILDHPGVAKVSFTGSTATGRRVLEASAADFKKVTLELGGKSGNVIFADADLDAAVQGALTGIFMNQGEVCCAGSRILVERSIYDEVVERLAEEAQQITLGHGLDDAAEMGAIVSAQQRERVEGYIELGQQEGARLVCGGDRPNGELASGYFLRPAVFADVTDEMRIAREEIFGPVASVMPFDDETHAITRANNTDYGLAAGIWTQNLARAHRVAAALQAGTVWVNTYNMVDPAAPFGGYKASGYGRDLGEEALVGYTQTKTVWVSLD